MENKNTQESKTPYQALKLLKQDMNNYSKFNDLANKGFLDKKRFFDLAYNLIKANFKQTSKAFILQDQINFIVNNEVRLNISAAIGNLLDNNLLCIAAVNPEGELIYKLTEVGISVTEQLKDLDGKKETK